MNKEEAADVLKGCDYSADIEIGHLVMKSLLKIQENGKLWMHDEIRDMGRQIATHNSSLWKFCDISNVTQCSEVFKFSESVNLDLRFRFMMGFDYYKLKSLLVGMF